MIEQCNNLILLDENNQTIQCVDSCNPDYYETSFDDNYCVNQCLTIYYTLNQTKICQYNKEKCNQFKPYEFQESLDSKQCLVNCNQNTKYYINQQDKICTSLQSCQNVSQQYFSGQILFQNYNDEQYCQQDCKYYIIENNINKCNDSATQCTDYNGFQYVQTDIKDTQNLCIRQCQYNISQIQQQQVCLNTTTCEQINQKLQDSICVSECTNIKWYFDNNENICNNQTYCSQNTNIYQYVSYSNPQQCIDQCEQNKKFYINSLNNEKYCTNFDNCEDDNITYSIIQLYNTNQCLQGCGQLKFLIENQTTYCIQDTQKCSDLNMFLLDNQCISQCQFVYQVSQEQENICQISCQQNEYIASNNSRQCVQSCDQQYIYNNTLGENMCIDQSDCQFYDQQQQKCLSECKNAHMIEQQQMICYQTKSCQNQGYSVQSASDFQLCQNSCQDSYIYVLEEQVCVSSCNEQSIRNLNLRPSGDECICRNNWEIVLNQSGNLQCVQCQNTYFNFTNTCNEICGFYLYDSENDQCVMDQSCSSIGKYYIIESDQYHQECNNCTSKYYFINETDSFCTNDNCTSLTQYPYLENINSTQCIIKCNENAYQYNNIVVCIQNQTEKDQYLYLQSENQNSLKILTDQQCQSIYYQNLTSNLTICIQSSNCMDFNVNIIQNGSECQTQCQEKLLKEIQNQQIYCINQTCQSINYYLYENICKEGCYDINNQLQPYKLDQNENTCISSCQSEIYVIQTQKQCLDNCSQQYKQLIQENYYICTQCEQNMFIIDNNEEICIFQCQNLIQINQQNNKQICVQTCQTGYFIYNNQCVDSCISNNLFVEQNSICVEFCNQQKFYENIENFCQLNEKCKLNQNYQKLQNKYNQKCVQFCQNLYFQQNQEDICIDQCQSEFKYQNNQQCVKQCDNQTYSSITYVCSQQQPQNCNYVIQSEFTQCLQNCSQYGYIDEDNRTCISECDKYLLQQSNNQPICTQLNNNSCQYYYEQNNQNICTQSCQNINMFVNNQQCTDLCNTTIYDYQNLTCLQQCQENSIQIQIQYVQPYKYICSEQVIKIDTETQEQLQKQEQMTNMFMYIVIGVGALAVIILLILIIYCACDCKRRKQLSYIQTSVPNMKNAYDKYTQNIQQKENIQNRSTIQTQNYDVVSLKRDNNQINQEVNEIERQMSLAFQI